MSNTRCSITFDDNNFWGTGERRDIDTHTQREREREREGERGERKQKEFVLPKKSYPGWQCYKTYFHSN